MYCITCTIVFGLANLQDFNTSLQVSISEVAPISVSGVFIYEYVYIYIKQ